MSMFGEGNWFRVSKTHLPLLSSMTKNEIRVLLAVCAHAGDDLICWPTVQTLGRLTGLEVKSAEKALKKLREKGVVERIDGRRLKLVELGPPPSNLRVTPVETTPVETPGVTPVDSHPKTRRNAGSTPVDSTGQNRPIEQTKEQNKEQTMFELESPEANSKASKDPVKHPQVEHLKAHFKKTYGHAERVTKPVAQAILDALEDDWTMEQLENAVEGLQHLQSDWFAGRKAKLKFVVAANGENGLAAYSPQRIQECLDAGKVADVVKHGTLEERQNRLLRKAQKMADEAKITAVIDREEYEDRELDDVIYDDVKVMEWRLVRIGIKVKPMPFIKHWTGLEAIELWLLHTARNNRLDGAAELYDRTLANVKRLAAARQSADELKQQKEQDAADAQAAFEELYGEAP